MPPPAQPWTSERLRERLAFDVAAWARVLGVSPATVKRWDAGADPSGLAAEVFRAIGSAIDAGVPTTSIHNHLSLGLGAFLRASLEK